MEPGQGTGSARERACSCGKDEAEGAVSGCRPCTARGDEDNLAAQATCRPRRIVETHGTRRKRAPCERSLDRAMVRSVACLRQVDRPNRGSCRDDWSQHSQRCDGCHHDGEPSHGWQSMEGSARWALLETSTSSRLRRPESRGGSRWAVISQTASCACRPGIDGCRSLLDRARPGRPRRGVRAISCEPARRSLGRRSGP